MLIMSIFQKTTAYIKEKQFYSLLLLISFLFFVPNVNAQMAFVAKSAVSSQTATSVTVTHPTTDPDHLMVAFVSSNTNIEIPAGWQLQNKQYLEGPTNFFTTTYTLYRWGTPGNSIFKTTDGSSVGIIVSMSAYSGVDKISPILAFGMNHSSKESPSLTFTGYSLNISAVPSIIISAAGQPVGGKTITTTSPSGTVLLHTATRLNLALMTNYHIVNNTDNYFQQFSASGPALSNWNNQIIALRAATVAPEPQLPTTCQTNTFPNTGILKDKNSTFWSSLSSWQFTPTVLNNSGVNRLRINNNGQNEYTQSRLKTKFPTAGNIISVEFEHFAYGGTGAQGMAVVFSDADVAPALTGFYSTSLGYSPTSGMQEGFKGGWLAVGIDEGGGSTSTLNGHPGYPAGWTPPAGANALPAFYPNNISIRGSGNSFSGYYLLANTTVSPAIWEATRTFSYKQKYRITLDFSDNVNYWVKVERDSNGSGTYTTVIPRFKINAPNSMQASAPAKLNISFTGTTSDYSNTHEIANASFCATSMEVPSVNAPPGSFDCLESSAKNTWNSTERSPLYTKISNTAFSFDVVALKSDGNIESNYVTSAGGNKTVLLELVDSSAPGSCASYPAVASQNITFSPSAFSIQVGRQTSSVFNLNLAKPKLSCRVTDSTDPNNVIKSCSTDSFTLRPKLLVLASGHANADSTGTSNSATPSISTGSIFSIIAGTNTPGYNGLPTAIASKIEWLNAPAYGRPQSPAPEKGAGSLSGQFSFPAIEATGSSADGNFSYNEAGYFRFQPDGVIDNSFSTKSNDSTQGDCITNSTSNILSSGKYGCNVGLPNPSPHFGRFVPKGFIIDSSLITNRHLLSCSPVSPFNYLGEQFRGTLFLRPVNANNETTFNYARSRFSDSNATSWNHFASNPMTSKTSIHSFDNSWNASGFLSAKINFATQRPPAPEGAHKNISIAVRPVDADAVTLMPASKNIDTNSDSIVDSYRIGTSDFYFGKMHINNHFGSDILPGSFAMNIQGYNGYGFQIQTIDSCTPLLSTNFLHSQFSNNLQEGELSWTLPSKIQNGTALIQYAKPSAGDGLYDGSLTLSYDLNAASLLPLLTNLPNGALGFIQNPSARISLGRKKTKSGSIFILEND